MKVRKAKRDDVAACVAIGRTPELTTLHVLSQKDALQYVDDFRRRGILLVAEKGGVVCGFITGEFMLNKYVWVDALVVKEEMRGRGVGTQLFIALKKEAKKKGYRHLFLIAPKWNKKTVAFY